MGRRRGGPSRPSLNGDPPPPRGWLLGNTFARKFISSLIASGGVGKTTLRYAQYIALATKTPITGEHVFQRCRVLIISLEDDRDELRRRVLAARKHYKIDVGELKVWLFYTYLNPSMRTHPRWHLRTGAAVGN